MKHKPTTLQKYIRRGNAFIAFLSDMDPAEITFCVSYGNKKIGKVLNVSKAPIFTCRGVCHKCKDFCYDIKACLQYTNVMEARMRNTVIFYKDRDLFFNRIRESMNKRKFNKFLRYDVGGEIMDPDEVSRIVSLAREYPDFIIWTYTKNHAAVNQFVRENGGSREKAMPENIIIMFSRVDGEQIDNPYHFPEFNCVTIEAGTAGEIDAPYCQGDYVKCRKEHTGCTAGESRNVAEH